MTASHMAPILSLLRKVTAPPRRQVLIQLTMEWAIWRYQFGGQEGAVSND